MWSALDGGEPIRLAGVIPWPAMPFDAVPAPIQWLVLDWAEGIHVLLVILLLAMIPMHVGAALKHHFWDRHDVLRGMLPEVPDDEPLEVPPRTLQEPGSPPARAGG
jgi:cytochrome b561